MEKMHKMENYCQIGDTVELMIEGVISDGRGLGRLPVDGGSVAVFVDDALPGQKVQVELVAVKPRLMEGRITQLLAPSVHEREAACVHADVCGGCPWQRLEYTEQLHGKASLLYETLRRVGKVQVTEEPVQASPQEWGYRNKMAFVFGEDKNHALTLGQRGRRSHTVTDLTACKMQDESTMTVLEAVRDLARTLGGAAGLCWRYAVVRRPRAGGLGIEIIVGPQGRMRGDMLYEELRKSVPQLTSFALTKRSARIDVAQGEKTLFTMGQELEERLSRPDGSQVRLHFNHASFLQVNTDATELLYAEILHALAPQGHERLWDMYCGVGSIGLFMAPYVAEVCGVESAASAVTLARQNATLNAATARYEGGDAAALFAEGALEQAFGKAAAPEATLMVVDPPRAGLDSHVVEGILRQKPARLAYVSCNPATLARDAALLAADYELVRAKAIDLFPQTPHVEAVASFVRKEL